MRLLDQQCVIVIATASPRRIDRMHELGAAPVIDYTTAPVLGDHPDGVDASVDLAGWTLRTFPSTPSGAAATRKP